MNTNMCVAGNGNTRQFVVDMEECNPFDRGADEVERAIYQGLQIFGLRKGSLAVIKIDEYMFS